MFETIIFLSVLGAVLFFGALISIGNERQRKAINGIPPVEAMELMLGKLKKTKSNIEFLLNMGVS